MDNGQPADCRTRRCVPAWLSCGQHGRPIRRAAILWAVLAVALSIKTACLGGKHSVYTVYDIAAAQWWTDATMYGDQRSATGVDEYRYSPTFAVFMTPFMLCGRPWGEMLWGWASIAMQFYALRVLVRDVLPGAWPPQREGVYLTLSLVGVAMGIWSCQSNALLASLILLALAAIQRQRWWWAAGWLAAAVYIKLWPIAIVLLLCACWPRQLIGRVAVMGLALAAVPFFTRPPDVVVWQYREWLTRLTHTESLRWPGYRDAWTIWEGAALWFGWPAQWAQPLSQQVFKVLQLTTAAAVLGWCLWQKGRGISTGRLLILVYGMWASWQLLFGPASEQLTYGIVAPATGWAVLVAFQESRNRVWTATAWAAAALLGSGDIEKGARALVPGGKMLLPLGVVLFVAWLLWHERGAAGLAAAAPTNALPPCDAEPAPAESGGAGSSGR